MLEMRQVAPEEKGAFRAMVEAYVREIQPHSDAARDPAGCDRFIRDEFAWEGGNRHPYWALLDGQPIGLMAFDVCPDEKRAYIGNFYVVPAERRRGQGSAMVRWLFAHLDGLGVERIDLNVRRDNPVALAFWQAQGFGLAGYSLRQYRDPQTGTAFIGALSSDFLERSG